MEFQVIDADYVNVNEKPVIRVFGKEMNGKTVCCFYEDFKPYFYALGENVPEKLKGNPQVVKIETVKRSLPTGYQPQKDVLKITLKNPARTVEVRDMLRSTGVKTFEADIPFKYRWMNDTRVGGMKWVSAEDTNGISTASVNSDKCIQIKKVKAIEREEDAPLKYFAFDIETVSDEENKMPEAHKDPLVLISIVFKPEYRGMKSVVLSSKPGTSAEACGDEKGVLKRFIEIINEYDPDVLTGYNVNGFDFPYILERMKRHNVKPIFGRCTSKFVRADKFANKYRVSIVGRVIADSFQIVKMGFNLKRYGLDFVGKELLGEAKDDVKKSEIGKLWRGSSDDLERLVGYCLQDSVLAMNLLIKRNLMDKYVALSKISGNLVQDIMDSGETQRIENYLLREFNKQGYIIPTKEDRPAPSSNDSDKKDFIKGGYVIEPKKGLHSMVLVLDFKSMYPSLIRTYNICPTTIMVDDKEKDFTELPNGAKFVNKNVRLGIVPEILENLMKERGKVKKMMKTADESLKKSLDMKQLAIKVMANAFYGYFGYYRAKIHNPDIASAITSLGRETISNTVKSVEGEHGYEVVYGDTDSVMVKVPTESFDEAEKIGNRVSEDVTKKLPGVMELEFEKLYKRFLPLTKKRYMAWAIERDKDGGWKEDIVMKGIETVRRDWCELTSMTMKAIIEIILKKEDVKAAIKYFRETVQKLLNGEIELEKLMITKTITKKPESYVGVQPHVEVIKKMQQRRVMEIPGIGDRIGYVIVKGTQLLSKRAEDPTYVKEKGLKVDSQYYIDNQMLPPLERIFTALGVDKEELLGMGKQIGIMEAINNHNNKNGETEPVTAKPDEVDGFICKSCNRSYRRPPLIGRCECGGNLLFSSTQGPAQKIKIS